MASAVSQNPLFKDAVAGLGRALASLQPKAAAPATDELVGISRERDAMTALKMQAWDMARTRATARADEQGLAADDPDRLPTLADYIVCARSRAMQQQVAASGIDPANWNNRSMVNFSGMQLNDIQFRKSDTDLAQLSEADRNALLLGSTDHHPNSPDVADREALHMGPDELGILYAEVSGALSFDETRLYNVHFHPADTFDAYVKGEATALVSCTFDGMRDGDTVTLQGGSFTDIRFTDIRGGHIDVANGTQIKGMDISGAHAALTIGRASIDGLNADGAHIVELKAAPGAVISNAQFNGTTIAMSSQLSGVVFNNIAITEANLEGLDLSGATLNNVTIDGQPASRALLESKGVTVDDQTRIESAGNYLKAAELSAPHPDPAEARAIRLDGIKLDGEVGIEDIALAQGVKEMARNPDTIAREEAQRAAAPLRMLGQ